jgi:hypothetical protein
MRGIAPETHTVRPIGCGVAAAVRMSWLDSIILIGCWGMQRKNPMETETTRPQWHGELQLE